jgi:hypothetical protein
MAEVQGFLPFLTFVLALIPSSADLVATTVHRLTF